jgi:hypothetical protein
MKERGHLRTQAAEGPGSSFIGDFALAQNPKGSVKFPSVSA